jgi:D-3-phosphoglycerate dehydrogenase / 2-oxoglutarate reductase
MKKREPKPKVIFIDLPHPLLLRRLEEAGYECVLAGDVPYADVELQIHRYTGVVINSRFRIGQHFIDKGFRLKFIARVGSGMESIDVEHAKKQGIRCFNSPEGNRDAVGEHSLGLLLAVMNNIARADQQVRQMQWQRDANRGHEIRGKTVGIIGYGNMGSAFAERLSGFGARVIAYDKYKSGFSGKYVLECSLDELQDTADVISLHVPLTEETTWMCDESFIRRCRKPFWLINTARGKVVKTEDLCAALKSGKVMGAGLDVLEYEDISFTKMKAGEEPEPLKYLLAAPNVVLTPHIAGWTAESKVKLADILAEKILSEFPASKIKSH